MPFNGFIVSACVHKIMEHTDSISKSLGKIARVCRPLYKAICLTSRAFVSNVVPAVCVLFFIKLRCPKRKNFYSLCYELSRSKLKILLKWELKNQATKANLIKSKRMRLIYSSPLAEVREIHIILRIKYL